MNLRSSYQTFATAVLPGSSGFRVPAIGFAIVFLVLSAGFISKVSATDARIDIALEKARLAYQMQKWQDVTVAAGELLTASPEHLEGHFMLAIAENRLGHHEAAVKRLTWLNFKVVDSAAYRYALAEALMAGGLREQAVVQVQYAVQLAPGEEIYRKFLAQITAVPAEKVASASNAVPAGSSTFSGEVVEDADRQASTPVKVIASRYEQIIRKVDEDCERSSQRALLLIFEAVSGKPELMADANWPLLQKRLQNKVKDTYQETIRQFLLWNSGELSLEEYGRYIDRAAVRDLAWEKDAVLQTISRYLAGYGVIAGRRPIQQQTAAGSSSWFSTLNESAREAFFDTRYDDAWALHIASTGSGSDDLRQYQSARLALELWQLHNFRREWLETARDHLEKCTDSPTWREHAAILLTEVNLILDGKAER